MIDRLRWDDLSNVYRHCAECSSELTVGGMSTHFGKSRPSICAETVPKQGVTRRDATEK